MYILPIFPKKKGPPGKDEPDFISPSVYPTLIFSTEVTQIPSPGWVTHEFCRAGGFYFRKKELQCIERSTPFIIYYLFTFNDLTTIRAKLTSLLGQAYEDMQDNFILPEEFEHHQLPKINIHRGVPKLLGQSGEQFCKYTRDMQEARRAHLIEYDISKSPFLRALINYIKEHSWWLHSGVATRTSLRRWTWTLPKAILAASSGCLRIIHATT
jgi:hypothetical protein